MPKEDLGQIFVGQLRSGELYALPASYYDFDLAVPESRVKRCAPGDASCARAIAPVSQAPAITRVSVSKDIVALSEMRSLGVQPCRPLCPSN